MRLEAQQLRAELQDLGNRMESTVEGAANAYEVAQEGHKRHRKRLADLQESAAALRLENERLESNRNQALAEERRLVKLLRVSEGESEEALAQMRLDCEELALENRALAEELEERRREVRELHEGRRVSTAGGERSDTPPRAGTRSVTPPARGPATTQQADWHRSSQMLRGEMRTPPCTPPRPPAAAPG